MTTPATGSHSSLHFDTPDEAAAFVAALSRFASSPAGLAAINPLELDVTAVDHGDSGVDVYLNSTAFAATMAGFGQPHAASTCDSNALPAERRTLLTRGERGAFGKDEMLRRLS